MKEMAVFGERNAPYQAVFGDVSRIIDAARESAARSVNTAMTAAYWLIGRRIIGFEQSGGERAEYGAALIERLAEDLTGRFGRGFSRQNVQNMRLFYLSYPPSRIRQTLSGKLPLSPRRQIRQTPSGISEAASVKVGFDDLLTAFPLPWSASVWLLSVRNESARAFCEVGDGIDNSLRRLNTDCVDLVQVHAYDISAPTPDDVLRALTDARDAGKTRFLGYSGENEDAVWALQSGLFDALQTSFNLVDQCARHLLFELAEANGVGIIAKRPIANAVWGKAVSGTGTEIVAGTTKERLRRAKAILDMGPIADAPEDPIAMALGFVLGNDEVATAIVGTGNPEHMLENIKVAETQLPIPESVVAELQRRFCELGQDWPGID